MKIDPYFLTQMNPFGKRRLNVKRLRLLAFAVIGGGIVVALIFGKHAEDRPAKGKSQSVTSVGSSAASATHPTGGTNDSLFEHPAAQQVRINARAARQYTASQIVGKGAAGNGAPLLPIGTMVSARLVNHLISSDAASPAVALVTADAMSFDHVVIPEGTKALGSASFSGSGERLGVRFHTLVYPDGSQHQISGLALLDDGSSGLAGTLHSDEGRRQAGSLLGYFVGGLAEGMQDRQTALSTGITLTPGSMRTGLLNGAAKTSLQAGKNLADSAQKVHPYLEIPAGSTFLIYLDKEYEQ